MGGRHACVSWVLQYVVSHLFWLMEFGVKKVDMVAEDVTTMTCSNELVWRISPTWRTPPTPTSRSTLKAGIAELTRIAVV